MGVIVILIGFFMSLLTVYLFCAVVIDGPSLLWLAVIVSASSAVGLMYEGYCNVVQESISKTICEQREGTYAGGKCIKDGIIMEE